MLPVEPLLTTKFYYPQPREGLVARPHLIQHLNAGERGMVSIISAPAGYGKTTLLSSWVAQSKHPVVWLSLDENDNNLSTFLTYLAAAIQRFDAGIGSDVLAALEVSQSPEAEILLTLLINGVDAREDQFTLVLDDCHLISSNEIFDALDFLIKYKTSGLHVILAGRVDPLISLPKLRVAGQLTEIRSTDLRFSKGEARVFLNEVMKLDLSDDDILALETRTEGWIAGLQLAALSLHQHEDKHKFINSFSGVHHHLIDYLVDEVLSLQSKEVKSFLCQSSILERFNASLCDATLEIQSSRQILRKLEETNMFLIPMDDQRRWFRYHHLFGSFLKLCLEEDLADRIPELHNRAARWLRSHGYDSEAFDHLLLAENMSEATRFVEIKAQNLLENSEFSKLIYWVGALPAGNVKQNPRLSIYHTWALRLTVSPYEVVENNIKDIEKKLNAWSADPSLVNFGLIDTQAEDELRNLKAHLYTLRAFQGVYRQDPTIAIEMAEKAKSFQPDEHFVLSSINFVLGWAYRLSGDLMSAHTAFTESSTISKQSGNVYMAVSTLCRAAYGEVLMGRLKAAEQEFMEGIDLSVTDVGIQNPVAGYAYVYLAGINLEWNNFDRAKRQALDGIQLCERVGFLMDQAIGYCYLARIFLAEGDTESAQDACQSAQELGLVMKDYLYVRRWVEDCQVRLWAAQGNTGALENWLQITSINPGEMPDFKLDVDQIILARALVELGCLKASNEYLDDGLKLLSNLQGFLEDAQWDGKLIEVLVLQARAFQFTQQDQPALHSLDQALVLAESGAYIRTFASEGIEIRNLFEILLDTEIEHEYAREVYSSFDTPISFDQEIPTSRLIEPLSARELDVMRMLATELSGPEIADQMSIALSTLRFHTRNIFGKLHVTNRRSAVRKARELHLA